MSTTPPSQGRHRGDEGDVLTGSLDTGVIPAVVDGPAEAGAAPRTTVDEPAAEAPTRPREQSVGRASALMAAGTMVSRVLGQVRTAMLVACIGVALVGDTFQTANTIPNTIFMLLNGGILTAVLIPQITKAMAREDGGQEAIDRLLTACFGLILVVTLLATALAGPLCYVYGMRGPQLTLGISFAYLCLPQIFFYGVYAILGQVLNARGSYAAFMWSPVIANVVQIAGMSIFLSRYGTRLPADRWTAGPVWLLAGTMTLGIVAQALVLLPALRRTGFRFRPRWGLRGQGFGSASRMAGWAFAALIVAQLGGWACATIMLTVARHAAEAHTRIAGVAIYQNAFLAFMLPHSIITTSILTALYPRMSRAANGNDEDRLRRLVTRGLTTPSVALVPITVAGLVLAVPGLGVMFLGSVMGEELRDLAIVFGLMIMGLIPFGWTTLQQRFFFAVEDGKGNLVLQGLLTVIQVGFALLALALPWRWAVATIALGQTLGNAAAALAFVVLAARRVGWLPVRHVVRLHVRLGIASTIPGLITWGVLELVQARLGWTLPSLVLQLAVGGLMFVGLFLVCARALHIREVDDLLSPVTSRLRRRGARGASA